MIIRRLIALFIDAVFISMVTSIICLFWNPKTTIVNFHFLNKDWVLNYNIFGILFLLYIFLFCLFNNGKTIGKILLSLKVVYFENKISRRLLREFIKSIGFFLLPITLIFYIFKKRLPQDYLSSTILG